MLDPCRKVGTEDLEAGMLPSHASSFATIAVIAVALLAIFNARNLVEWTPSRSRDRALPPSRSRLSPGTT